MKRNREDNWERSMFPHNAVQWIRGPLLGSGGFGSVSMAFLKKPTLMERPTTPMAVKTAEYFSAAELIQEKLILDELGNSVCPHPNVIRTYGDDITITGHGNVLYNVFLEFASGGTLSDLIRISKGLSESQVKHYTACILSGIGYIHDKGFVHCDLKPQNILLVAQGSDFIPKICDFGLSKKARSDEDDDDGIEVRGTAIYLSPEAVFCKTQQQPSDIWALGCLVLQMFTGRPPWELRPGPSGFRELENKLKNQIPCIPDWISEEGKNFLHRCFEKKPEKRNTASMLLKHPFLAAHTKIRKNQQHVTKLTTSSSILFVSEDAVDYIPLGEDYIPLGEDHCSSSSSSSGLDKDTSLLVPTFTALM